ncbi:MAG: hypothetical protein ACMG6S_06705 [Byssovorax sp.]
MTQSAIAEAPRAPLMSLAEWESLPEDEPGELEPSGRYALAVSTAEGTVSEVPGCEDLAIDLDALWAEADQLESQEGANK